MQRPVSAELTRLGKMVVLIIVLLVVALFVGLVGLMADWAFAQPMLMTSGAGFLAILWLFGEMRSSMADRIFYGQESRNKRNENA